MTSENYTYTRRDFFKKAGTAGASAIIAPGILNAADKTGSGQENTIPLRPFGKTGVTIPILSLGGGFDISTNQIIVNVATKWGITYFDTAHEYGGGLSEIGIGKYIKAHPDNRKNLFIVTKSKTRETERLSTELGMSLQRMNTDYIDLYFLHDVGNINELSGDIRKWVDAQKQKGAIRLFGFSTHNNMERCMMDASKLDWVDGIMMSYNFRLMHHPEMNDAVQACFEKGIGLTAMKTQGGGSVKMETDSEHELAAGFIKQGFTLEQAKLKAVWEDKRISSICSLMTNSTILMANIAAAMDRKRLTATDMKRLRRYACDTSSSYCAGCGYICESVFNGSAPISTVMRNLMYHRSYGDKGFSGVLDKKLAADIKRMSSLDFSSAEKKCPQNMPIGQLMKEATLLLA